MVLATGSSSQANKRASVDIGSPQYEQVKELGLPARDAAGRSGYAYEHKAVRDLMEVLVAFSEDWTIDHHIAAHTVEI